MCVLEYHYIVVNISALGVESKQFCETQYNSLKLQCFYRATCSQELYIFKVLGVASTIKNGGGGYITCFCRVAIQKGSDDVTAFHRMP